MPKVAVVDLCHSGCPSYRDCVEKRVKEAFNIIANGQDTLVYILLDQQGQTLEGMNPNESLLQSFADRKEKVTFLVQDCVAASLYRFKRAVDKLDLNDVLVITGVQGKAQLQVYQSLLFTPVYRFQYAAAFSESLCPLREVPSSKSLSASVEEEVAAFLHRLPAALGEISILRSSLISDEFFSHGFSTRTGGISYISTLSSLNLFSSSRRRDPRAVVSENIRRLSVQAGFDPAQFHLIKTDHASDVWVMGKPEPVTYDGIVTNRAGVVIAAPGADCMPLLFADPVAKVIGVAHAGWKGTLMGIAMATVNAMTTEFGSQLADITVVIGPSVGPCCFTLDQNSAREFEGIHPDCVKSRESTKPAVDIRLATRILLQQGGILPHCIQDNTVTGMPNVTLCTACHPDTFFSHVRDGNNFGTQIGFLWIKEACKNGH